MLTCYGHSYRLSQGDLTYLAFRLSLLDTLEEVLLSRDLGEDPDCGFLMYVPILEQVPSDVQIDLLADVWSRQRQHDLIEANLMDAAIVYAACENATRIVQDEPQLAGAYLQNGPRTIETMLTTGTPDLLEALFERFWDDLDFLALSDWVDMDPEQVAGLKKFLRFPDDQPIYDALSRGRVSSGLPSNLEGLLTAEEITEVIKVIGPAKPSASGRG